MIKKMIKHGNSAAIVIDKPIMELLNFNMDTPLEIITDGKNLIISPIGDELRKQKIKKALDKINARHGATLEKLAK